MTFLGKLLTFLNLLVGLGVLTTAVFVYADRPAYFDEPPEAVDKGNSPVTFKQLQKDAAGLKRQAELAGAAWGENLKALERLEKRRDDRRKVFAERLGWARDGRPKHKDGAGFFEPVYEKNAAGQRTNVLDATAVGPPVAGPDDLPLKGADALLKGFDDAVAARAALAKQIEALRVRYGELSDQIKRDDDRLLALTRIRDEVQAEAFYLEAVEVNVYETRETVFRRKRQLDRRLAELGK